jgi:lysophospholipase L1-like esterase
MESLQMKMNECSLSRRLPLVAAASLSIVLALSACGGGHSYSNTAGGTTDFTRTVFVGDSLTAGYQNGSLLDTQQPHGYANLVATAANFKMTLPLIAPPGAPSVLELQSINPLVIVSAPGTTSGRDDITITPSDVAVPGAFVYDVLNTYSLPDPTTGEEEITALVLGYPGLLTGVPNSQYSLALSENPTTIFAWIGNNDALVADEAGSPDAMTPVAPPAGQTCATSPLNFQCEYTQTIGALAQTKTTLYVANVPDVTAVPYLVSGLEVIEQVVAESGLPEPEVEAILGLLPTDYINLTTYATIPSIVACAEAGAPCPLTSGVLHAADIITIQQTVDAYNQIIEGVAAAVGAHVVDINTVFANGYANGVTVNGYTGTYAFLGGLFGLDGIHPTNTGYGVLANAFISEINSAEGANIAPVSLTSIAATDPLWPPNFPASSGAQQPARRLNGRPVGKLPTYGEAKIISDAVHKSLSANARARIQKVNPKMLQ